MFISKALFRRLVFIAVALSALGLATLMLGYLILAPQLPAVESLRDIQLQTPLRVFSKEGKLMAMYGEKRRIPLHYDEIPSLMSGAFLAAEDDRFYQHPGVDYQGLMRAVYKLLLTGQKVQGGSTITMQLARNFFLSNERTYTRKIKEILLALRIEKALSKHEILALYLNKIYLGHRAYGIGAAADAYYGLHVEDLNLAQIAMIAGLPKAPSRFNPISNPSRALIRRNYVLGRMLKLDMISQSEYDTAKAQAVVAKRHRPTIELDANYISEMVRAEMYERYGEEAYISGYRVFTTIEAERQQAAQLAVQKGIEAYVPVNNRSQIIRQNSNEILLDAYNANPSSMEVALENFKGIQNSQKLAILGDMFELGATSAKEHLAVVNRAIATKDCVFYFVGSHFFEHKTNLPKVLFFETFKALQSHLKQSKISNTNILIKGSRGMALERVLELI